MANLIAVGHENNDINILYMSLTAGTVVYKTNFLNLNSMLSIYSVQYERKRQQ
jgi:hypothetical protein